MERTLKPRISSARWHEFFNGWFFTAPWTIGLIVFLLFPVVYSLYLSFTNKSILGQGEWVGLSNYIALFSDSMFQTAVYNTLYLAVFLIPSVLLLQLFLAILLNTKGLHGLSIYRTIFFVPSIVPAVASAFIWLWMLDPQYGPVNLFLQSLGLPRLNWLNSVVWSKPAHLIINIWIGIGMGMVIFLAALQDVPEHLYEAAEIDGANAWQKTLNVTLPMISPTILFNLVITLITTFQYFTQAWVLGTLGTAGTGTLNIGAPAHSTLFYVYYLYVEGFRYYHLGYASTMAWLLLLVILVITGIVFKTSGRWVYYGGIR